MKIIINDELAGQTVYTVLRRKTGYSYTYFKTLKHSGKIKLNGECTNSRCALKAGDVLEVDDADTEADADPYLFKTPLEIEILYEDEYMTAVNKPAGMPTHPSHGHFTDTLANALAYKYKDRPYVFRAVNRLDRNTSGIVLTANSRYAASVLSTAISEKKFRKLYAAIIEGVLEQKGVIKSYIKRERESIITRISTDDPDGADYAETVYETAAVFDAPTASGKASLVIASPLTGRTHQLRVHFSSLSAPIAGDDLYGGHTDIINRQALHAFSLSFPKPDGGDMTLYAPAPDDFTAALELYSHETALILSEILRIYSERKR